MAIPIVMISSDESKIEFINHHLKRFTEYYIEGSFSNFFDAFGQNQISLLHTLVICDNEAISLVRHNSLFETITNLPVIIISNTLDQKELKRLNNYIDVLSVPLKETELERALEKFKKIKSFVERTILPERNGTELQDGHAIKKRILLKRTKEYLPVLLTDIVFFYVQNKITFAVDKYAKKIFVPKNIGELEENLCKKYFFRANRQQIINIEFISSFKQIDKVRIMITMKIDTDPIIIAQTKVHEFRNWIESV
ncbi:LytTR family DNA-binding domain-containing protein [Sediminibacterium sp.]|uniref:LytR/AlgR family response regulator transcription factor n=1 Tax=Sediminibacterium sp. TaxID=1917865 RepID=UPI0025E0C23C|nr:LytTR family DNA-binding domain-containing protein [Sediminibacterium sp.]MBW0177164.1 LytTR family transcriptional regulator [Sediminibacterium sp.]